jgi:NAD(P)-dependent dehydrogenase (short-subunit alcohol dehydrogenase family)
MIDYGGKTALVTGGGSGIGQALAEALSARGARVLVADRNVEGAERVAAGIGGQAGAIACDLGDAAAPEALIAAAYERLGRVDLVCSNAGVGRARRLLKEPFDEAAMKVFEVNMFAGIRLAQAYVPELERRGARGRLMLTGSENSLSVPDAVKHFGMGVYAASKHGLLIMAEWLLVEARAKPLDLHVLLPGGVYTPLIAGALPDVAAVPPEMNIISPARCADLALRGMDLGLFYIPTHAHIADDMRPRTEGVRASLRALGLPE